MGSEPPHAYPSHFGYPRFGQQTTHVHARTLSRGSGKLITNGAGWHPYQPISLCIEEMYRGKDRLVAYFCPCIRHPTFRLLLPALKSRGFFSPPCGWGVLLVHFVALRGWGLHDLRCVALRMINAPFLICLSFPLAPAMRVLSFPVAFVLRLSLFINPLYQHYYYICMHALCRDRHFGMSNKMERLPRT